jgi:hypothetical protein
MDGVAYILWDNIPRGSTINCQHIERSCTAETFTDRKLGVSEKVQASAATVHLFTGNNIGPKGDLASRSLQVRIEVERVDPENRPFKHTDPIGWTEANRTKILRALYTILLGNPELRKPRSAPAKTRFKLWWRVVGGAVEHAAQCAGKEIDFRHMFLEQEADEDDTASLADALAYFNKRWSGMFKAAEVAHLINENGDTPDGMLIREFLFPGSKSGQVVSAKGVGKRLVTHVGNPVRYEDKTLALCNVRDAHSKVQTFFVKETKVG